MKKKYIIPKIRQHDIKVRLMDAFSMGVDSTAGDEQYSKRGNGDGLFDEDDVWN